MNLGKLLLAGCAIVLCTGLDRTDLPYSYQASVEADTTTTVPTSDNKASELQSLFTPAEPLAGSYLSARFAQARHDWEQANSFLDQLVTSGVSDPTVLRRAMILSMGSGNHERAIQLAQRIIAVDPESQNSVAQVFLIMDAIGKEKYDLASQLILKTPKDEMTQFIGPVLESWTKAGLGKLEVTRLQENPLQLYHAILIADYLQQPDQVKKLLEHFANSDGMALGENERIADLYAYTGRTDRALELYEALQKEWPGDRDLSDKIKKVRDGKGKEVFQSIKSPRYGLGLAFFDIAKVLYQEFNDESARVLASMAIYLNPDITEAKFLLAYIAIRHERFEEAITYYQAIGEGDKFYLDARRNIADAYESMERYDDALKILKTLSDEKKDIESQIKIGDIYRPAGRVREIRRSLYPGGKNDGRGQGHRAVLASSLCPGDVPGTRRELGGGGEGFIGCARIQTRAALYSQLSRICVGGPGPESRQGAEHDPQGGEPASRGRIYHRLAGVGFVPYRQIQSLCARA
jgi:tetratricopeptide (TPR) repeat protein